MVPSRIVSFGILLNFNKPLEDYEKFGVALVDKGFEKRFPEFGYLLRDGQTLDDLDRESKERARKLFESSFAEKVSFLGKYSGVSRISHNSMSELFIGHKSGLQNEISPNMTHNILNEVSDVIELLKEILHLSNQDLSPCRLWLGFNVKSDRKSSEVLSALNGVKDISFLREMLGDFEIAIWEGQVYLYAIDIDLRQGGDVPIIEDMKRKNLHPIKSNRKSRWEKIELISRSDEYGVLMEYVSDRIDDIMNMFEAGEERALKIISEIESRVPKK